jgi:hypothetical protein
MGLQDTVQEGQVVETQEKEIQGNKETLAKEI